MLHDAEKDGNVAELLLERISDVLLIAADVTRGNYSSRLQSDLPPDHPLANLFEGINQMVDSLAREKERSIAYQKELEEKLGTIEVQRAAIRELSTPIIEVWEGVLCLPVVGVLDSTRSAEMMEALLTAIVEKKAECAIIDITGIQVMDTGTADHFLRTARAVRLLGANCLLTGINPAIAQTLVHVGIDLGGIVTHRSMRTALVSYIRKSLARLEEDEEEEDA